MRWRAAAINNKKTALERIKKIFKKTRDGRLIDAINIRNTRNLYIFSILVCIFDAISLILFTAANWTAPDFWKTFFSVSFCVFACAVVATLSKKMIQKYEKEGFISNIKASVLVIFFYAALSSWGVWVDATHYIEGNQMITFYIVQFCFVCFVVMPPKTGSLLIALSFTSLYLSIYLYDGAARLQPQNFVIFAVIAVIGNAIQHMMLQESEEYKADILELNEILRHEATVDDLTKLKNRTALRNDFEKHIGQNVYTVMADVDRFKHFNDVYGHVGGDELLRLVASATGEAFREGDVYRYGGDEFLVVLPDCSEAEFEEKIKNWQAAVKAIRIPEVECSVLCSFGYDHRMLKNVEDLRTAIITADNRLYEAKKARCAAVES